MARKRKGFTLVELLVALACAALFLACVSASMVFISRLGGKVLADSSDLYKLGSLCDYIRENKIVSADRISVGEGGSVGVDGKELFSESNITGVAFETADGFVRCVVTLEASPEQYSFIVG